MTFFAEAGAELVAGEAAKGIAKGIRAIGPFIRKTSERLKDGSLGIMIFGPQGTGKTTLLNVLSGKSSINDLPTEYKSSPRNEYESLDKNFYFKVVAGPGQEALQNIHWPEIFDKANKFDRVICIYCASYGCHSVFEESFLKISQETRNINEKLVIEEYLRIKRVEESKIFKELCTKLESVKGCMGLMLLVTKQDLWWAERAAVEKHYSRGAFANGFKALQQAKSAIGFVGAKKSASLSLQNLLTTDHKLLVPTASGYDQLLQRKNFDSFEDKLIEMAAALSGK